MNKFMKCKIFLCFLSVFFPVCAYSNIEIISIQGDRSLVSLERNKKKVAVQEFLPLKDGDEIVLNEGEVEVLLDLGNGERLHITQQNSPYIVYNNTETASLVRNGLAWLKKRSTIFDEQSAKTVETISRGSGVSSKITLVGMDLRKNIIPADMEHPADMDQLLFLWKGGEPPYRITVYDQEEDITIYSGEASETETTIPLSLFDGSDFLIEIKDKSGAINFADKQEFTIVRDSEVPRDVVELDHALEHKSYQLKVACLATIPEYQFYALQMAKINNDVPLMKALLSMQQYYDN